jgi:hypothetical protein
MLGALAPQSTDAPITFVCYSDFDADWQANHNCPPGGSAFACVNEKLVPGDAACQPGFIVLCPDFFTGYNQPLPTDTAQLCTDANREALRTNVFDLLNYELTGR